MFIPNKNKFPPDPEKPHYYTLMLQKEGVKTQFKIDLNKGALFINLPSYHQCSIQNDRLFYITPLINKLAQVMRAFKMPIIRIVKNSDIIATEYQRKRGNEAIKGGKYVIGALQTRSSQYFQHLSQFDFVGKCMYLDNYVEETHNDVIPDLANGFRDLFITDISKSIYAIAGSGAKYVFICGENLDSDLANVVMQCQNAGITPIIVEGIVDSEYVYELGKSRFKSHSDLIRNSLKHLTQKHSYSITYNELLSNLFLSKGKVYNVRYSKENNSARIFKCI